MSDRWGSQFCQKERKASRLLYFPFRCPFFSLFLPLFFLFPPCLSWALKAPDNARSLARCGWTVIGRRILSRRLHRRVEVWRAVISQVLPRDGEAGGAVPRASSFQPLLFLSHLCMLSVPFVNQDLVKSLQRKEEKELFRLQAYS